MTAPIAPQMPPLTPSNVVGMVQRSLMEIHTYLNTNGPLTINTAEVRALMTTMMDHLEVLGHMQKIIAEQNQPPTAGDKAKAN